LEEMALVSPSEGQGTANSQCIKQNQDVKSASKQSSSPSGMLFSDSDSEEERAKEKVRKEKEAQAAAFRAAMAKRREQQLSGQV